MNYHMHGISKEDGRSYISKKIEGAGCRQEVFTESAAEAILNSANGIPRMINKLCTRSLIIGEKQHKTLVDAEIVMCAVNDTQLGD